jgi:aromatic-amino-acid transaminase
MDASIHTMHESAFGRLRPRQPDALLGLIRQYRSDKRAEKLDLGVGVYRDAAGATPILRSVKAAERELVESQTTKGYLGPEGDLGFIERLKPIIFGDRAGSSRLAGVQTPGGTGALRLAGELLAVADSRTRVWIGTPTWPNHQPILAAAGLSMATYRYFDPATQVVCFDEMMTALDNASSGDVFLLHGCCHNPPGADLDIAQWFSVAEAMAERGLIPLIDLAYQGLGDGLESDAGGMRLILDRVGVGLVAYSCDKNFGLYRERTGALYALSGSADTTAIILTNLLSLARANWSMPPDHGAALVRLILESPELTEDWQAELAAMRLRLAEMRELLAAADPAFVAQRGQKGIFSLLDLTSRQVARLRDEYAVYMPASGRINLAGLSAGSIPVFAQAFAAVSKETRDGQH